MKRLLVGLRHALSMLSVCEFFSSIQGEGLLIGMPATFVRLSGCNLHCSYCDTKYHVEKEAIGFDALLAQVRRLRNRHIVWTGGEPLIQWEGLKEAIKKLGYEYEHHLETNGVCSLESNHAFHFSSIAVSPKLKSSGQVLDVDEIVERWVELVRHSYGRVNVFFKFVISNEEDRAQLGELIQGWTSKAPFPVPIVLQPQTEEPDWKHEFNKTIHWATKEPPWNTEPDIRLMPRWHMLLWGKERKK